MGNTVIDRNILIITNGYNPSDTSFVTDLATAISQIGSEEKTLVVDGTITIDSAITIPSNICLKMPNRESTIQKSGSATLTINGPFEAGLYQVFSGFSSGDVTFGGGSVKYVSPEWWEAQTDGATDNSTAIQAAVDSLSSSGGTVELTAGRTYRAVTPIVISKLHITIKGPGIFDGTFVVAHPISQATADPYIYATFDGINFTTANTSINAIEVWNGYNVNVTNNYFTGYNAAFSVPDSINTTTYGPRHTQEINITDNIYDSVSYFIYTKDTNAHGASFSSGDTTVSNNQGIATISHVYADSIDGLTVSDNTFFSSPSVSTGRSIHIIYGVNVNVHDNKIYTPGREGVLLDLSSQFDIHDNEIQWAGAYYESPGIKITGIPADGAYYSLGNIHDNRIVESTGHGIMMDTKSGRAKVHNNHIYYPGRDQHYYGVPALSGTAKLIDVASDTKGITVNDNFGTFSTYNISAGGAEQSNIALNNVLDLVGDLSLVRTESQFLIVSQSTGSTIDVSRGQQVNLSHGSVTNITALTNSSQQAKIITLRSFSNNITLINSAGLALKGGLDVGFSSGYIMTFYVDTSNNAIEVSRNF